LSASPYVLIAASTAVVGTLLVTELIRRKVSLENEVEEQSTAPQPGSPAPSIEEIASEDFSVYVGVHEVMVLPEPPQAVVQEKAQPDKPKRQRRRRIGKRLEKKIIKMWERGVPVKKIAEELGLSYSAVYRRIKRYKENFHK